MPIPAREIWICGQVKNHRAFTNTLDFCVVQSLLAPSVAVSARLLLFRALAETKAVLLEKILQKGHLDGIQGKWDQGTEKKPEKCAKNLKAPWEAAVAAGKKRKKNFVDETFDDEGNIKNIVLCLLFVSYFFLPRISMTFAKYAWLTTTMLSVVVIHNLLFSMVKCCIHHWLFVSEIGFSSGKKSVYCAKKMTSFQSCKTVGLARPPSAAQTNIIHLMVQWKAMFVCATMSDCILSLFYARSHNKERFRAATEHHHPFVSQYTVQGVQPISQVWLN